MLNDNLVKELEWKGGLMKEIGEQHCPHVRGTVKMYHKADRPAFNTVTNPFLDNDDDVVYFVFDEDLGAWKEDSIYLCTKQEYEQLERIAYSSI